MARGLKWTPHDYMKRAIKLIVSQPAAGLLLDPGMGKTSIILGAFKLLQKRGAAARMLVIAPLRACKTWVDEASKWKDFSGLDVVVLHGSNKADLLRADADVFVINPEGVTWLLGALKRKRWPFEMLVVDESTKYKHSQTKRFKILKKVLGRFKRRYILTGTPAPNGLEDLFGQIYVLDQGGALGEYITRYRVQYFYPNPNGFGWELVDGCEEQIYDAIGPMVLRLAAEDYLTMPPLLQHELPVVLPPKARALYETLKKQLVIDLAEGTVTAVNAGVLTAKLRQVASGSVYTSDPAERATGQVHDAKIERVKDLVDELGGKPVLVAYQFDHEREVLAKTFNAPAIAGGVSRKRADTLIEEWNAGALPVLLIHPASAAHGINLQRGGHNLIWYSPTWNLEEDEQLVRRLWRQGQEMPVSIYRINAANTIDDTITRVLRQKRKTQNALFQALREDVV